MDGHRFEELIEELFRKLGYRVEGHRAAADGGVDITAISSEPIVGGKYIIQCKRQKAPIGEPVVRDLYGVITHENANKGIVITNADFTMAAVKFAEGKPIELLNGIALLRLLGRFYKTEVDTTVPRLTFAQEAMFLALAQEIQAVKEAYEPIAAGAMFRRGKNYRTEKGFLKFASEKSYEMQNFTGVLTKLFQRTLLEFEMRAKEPGFDSGKHIQASRALVKSSLSEFCRSYQSVYYVEMPSRGSGLKTALLDTYTALFEALLSWRNQFLAVVSSPGEYLMPDGTINLALDYPDRKRITVCADRLRKEAKALRRGCFIATAVYGSFDDPAVCVLRRFRDGPLASNLVGRAFIGGYYFAGPVLASLVERIPLLRSVARIVLDHLVDRLEPLNLRTGLSQQAGKQGR